ncbi:beta-ketoacyl-ACP synthase III [Streptomyces sp. NPDC102462]|uniref:beta-ketoacyl-ACP synthase III n=1 Tax=Streptomyces sp. NPDC102462 TaxID=3366178 RepID=UPI003810F63A
MAHEMTEGDGITMSASVIRGMGVCLPQGVVTNDDLVDRFQTSDTWIRTRTGIHRRRWVEPGTSTGDLATVAGAAALTSAGTDADFVLLATTTPDRPCPATAPEVASRIGLTDVPAVDVSAVCSGFVYGLALASSLISSGVCTRPLLIGAEVYTSIIDPLDRGTGVIFGDGAGAVLLERGDEAEPGAVHAFALGSDGSNSDLIAIAAGGSRAPHRDVSASREDRYFRMQGRSVYTQAIQRMTSSCRSVLSRTGWSSDAVEVFVSHQANQRIVDAVGDRLGIDTSHRFGNIAEVGNTAAASLPLAMADTAGREGVVPGARTLLTAFGGGLTWGSVALNWPDVKPIHHLHR